MKIPESYQLRRASLSIQVLDHTIRRQIIKMLSENENLTVSEIQHTLRKPQSTTSQHLALLRRAGYIEARRDGKEMHYRLISDALAEDIQHILALAK